jgi:glutamate mutase epsilon subunit
MAIQRISRIKGYPSMRVDDHMIVNQTAQREGQFRPIKVAEQQRVAMDHLKDHLEILQEARQEDQTAILPIEIQDLGRRTRKKQHPPTKKRTSKSCLQLS